MIKNTKFVNNTITSASRIVNEEHGFSCRLFDLTYLNTYFSISPSIHSLAHIFHRSYNYYLRSLNTFYCPHRYYSHTS